MVGRAGFHDGLDQSNSRPISHRIFRRRHKVLVCCVNDTEAPWPTTNALKNISPKNEVARQDVSLTADNKLFETDQAEMQKA